MEQKKKLKTKRSKAGLGLFTQKPIKKGEFVIEYTGKVLSRAEADKKGGKYLFETSFRRVIDGSGRDNIARYINHSCRPNCEVDIKKGRILIYAKRNIKVGEEITYDYDKEYFDEYIKPNGCVCDKCAK
jgi:SET domain-containing protein